MAKTTARLTPSLKQAAEEWAAQDFDDDTRAALSGLLARAESGEAAALAELADAFAGPLTFGTAGLRAALGPGPGRMNRVVVTQAAAGFADWLLAHGAATGDKVLIGYDARHKSADFARDTAEVMAAAGLRPLLSDRAVPTPVVAFGVVHLGCAAGVQVTASHNPAADNGYKVYLGDGSQIIPPTDAEIAALIAARATQPVGQIARSDEYETVGDELLAAYAARVAGLLDGMATRDIVWAYTAMHGVGAPVLHRVVKLAGLPTPAIVENQINADPDFPTVPFPNPEEPGAMDLVISLASSRHADIAIATDPDADRCAAAVLVDGTWRRLTGDEVGALLGDYAMRRGASGVYAASLVSSTLLGTMARANGFESATTLTGFKWIGRVPRLAFGYEEAIGYCCDPAVVRDKDGISATAMLLRLTAELKTDGLTIADRLAQIDQHYGVHATAQHSVRVDKLSQIADMMARLRANPPTSLAGQAVTVIDRLADDSGASPITESEPLADGTGPSSIAQSDSLAGGTNLPPTNVVEPSSAGNNLPPTDAVEFSGASVHVVVRPSGTEPKLKCYCEARRPAEEANRNLVASRAAAASTLEQLWHEIDAVLSPPPVTG